ncbi:hypothetical protein [Granulosicoccus antarcticus]|uniref:Lipoprotein n=1 Tax=Granulosicoccus antarcticus IMCC3135 TaxID=1192854 RepID=A0A2Z2NKY6_9GAMM|nr:hypothetical protein [Granulosicoccus antarcticus]ASJ72082.1 hypothetical protein IMCC3135_09940 [Granulosicoccus antarcticus IMCC3135]
MMIKTRMWVLLIAAILTGCGGSGGDTPEPQNDDPDVLARNDIRDVDELAVYRTDSPYASLIKECALVETADEACTLEALPFIAQATPDFTKEDIMNRLLVTHDWMGERFETLLEDAPDSMIPLFGSLTSIVIGSTVRPSHYWAGTGGIQLDPATLWLSLEEKANVSIADDYRSEFDKDLQFWEFVSMRIGDAPAIQFFDLSDREERTLKDIEIPVYRLLYHELSHAVDYLPTESIATLDSSLVPARALDNNSQLFLSPRLNLDLPLYSQTLYDLGQVSFQGEIATEEQQGFTPTFVGSEMANDGAAEFYGYNTLREDFATLFTAGMMKREFNIDYYSAFVNKPVDESQYRCDELLVGWGVKNRLADTLVAARARWVAESIYGPNTLIDGFFANELGEAVPMTVGLDWCSNRDGVTTIAALKNSGAESLELNAATRRQLEGERRRHTH